MGIQIKQKDIYGNFELKKPLVAWSLQKYFSVERAKGETSQLQLSSPENPCDLHTCRCDPHAPDDRGRLYH